MRLLTAPLVAQCGSFQEFWAATRATRASEPSSIGRAVAGGFAADRLGYAFLAGYTAAITALDPSLGPDELGALCATEAGGGHPRAIEATLVDGRLDGTKHFVSGGSWATQLLVIANAGAPVEGRRQLRLARLARSTPGVSVEDLPPLDFVPEIPHGIVTFTRAQVERVFEGDGYERALKPFRTIEDLHVFGAALGYLVRVGRRSGWPRERLERLLAFLAAIEALAARAPSDPEGHLALAGVIAQVREFLPTLDWTGVEPAEAARFERDLPLLRIAEKVREARRQRAWET